MQDQDNEIRTLRSELTKTQSKRAQIKYMAEHNNPTGVEALAEDLGDLD